MKEIAINFSNKTGIIKPMHAVNNGPVYKVGTNPTITNIDAYISAGIPYARNHDASFFASYGGEHIVDVNMIFTDFDNDPYAPESYDFVLTDEYLKAIEYAGTKVFYRLGSKIEHWSKKYNTLPPKDFHKWAVICEHIIKHYTCGWANGFYMDIEYWEIWNEPDMSPDDAEHKTTWGGTKKQFFEFYDIVATHLKKTFPNLKIGGPALAYDLKWAEDFLSQLQAPLDFFSWHDYSNHPYKVVKKTNDIRNLLEKYGFKKTESILNEWNYVKEWSGQDLIYTRKTVKNMKGAAYIAAVMTAEQETSLNMLMYYDARPSEWNGMFSTDLVCDRLKGYYPFKAFNELYKLGIEYESEGTDEVFVCAAKKNNEAAIMVTRFIDDDGECENIKVNISGLTAGIKAEYYLLDQNHDLTLVKEEIFSSECFSQILSCEPHSMYLIKLKKLDSIEKSL